METYGMKSNLLLSFTHGKPLIFLGIFPTQVTLLIGSGYF
jgi:hypothetical protein